MGIFVSIEDQNGDLAAQAIYFQFIQKYFRKLEQATCLKYVYEDEDTVFNTYQLPGVKNDLKLLEAMNLNPQEKDELDQLNSLVKKMSGKKNHYLKFYGEARVD